MAARRTTRSQYDVQESLIDHIDAALVVVNNKIVEFKATVTFQYPYRHSTPSVWHDGLPKSLVPSAQALWQRVVRYLDWRCGYLSLVKFVPGLWGHARPRPGRMTAERVTRAATILERFLPRARRCVEYLLRPVRDEGLQHLLRPAGHRGLAEYIAYRAFNLVCQHHSQLTRALEKADELAMDEYLASPPTDLPAIVQVGPLTMFAPPIVRLARLYPTTHMELSDVLNGFVDRVRRDVSGS